MPFVINVKRKIVLIFFVAEQLALLLLFEHCFGTLLGPT